MTSIQKNITGLIHSIHEYESRYGRGKNSVTLIAASKSQPVAKILTAIQAGLHRFGENYLQEALPKIEALRDEKIEWHFIGPIQSNKTKKIAEHFAWVHSVSAFTIAERLNDQRPPHLPPLNICLQVNLSHELSKSGLHPDEVYDLAAQFATLPRLKLRGLMAIPKPEKDFTKQRASFHQLAALQNLLSKNGVKTDTLSIGMSDDMEAAIAEGSTLVRIGTKIFGNR